MAGLFVIMTTIDTFLTGYLLARLAHNAEVTRKLVEVVAVLDDDVEHMTKGEVTVDV